MEDVVSKDVLFKNLKLFIFNVLVVSCIKQRLFFILSQLQLKKMESYDLFNKYLNFETINENQLDLVVDYICGNLNSCFRKYPYWYDMYCYSTKSRIVIRHRKNKNENAVAVLGECVCQNQIINFLKNKDNLCNCDKGCASVYFNVVF